MLRGITSSTFRKLCVNVSVSITRINEHPKKGALESTQHDIHITMITSSAISIVV